VRRPWGRNWGKPQFPEDRGGTYLVGVARKNEQLLTLARWSVVYLFSLFFTGSLFSRLLLFHVLPCKMRHNKRKCAGQYWECARSQHGTAPSHSRAPRRPWWSTRPALCVKLPGQPTALTPTSLGSSQVLRPASQPAQAGGMGTARPSSTVAGQRRDDDIY
jgi:hypothetical protein